MSSLTSYNSRVRIERPDWIQNFVIKEDGWLSFKIPQRNNAISKSSNQKSFREKVIIDN